MRRRLLTALFVLVAALSLFSRWHQAHAVAGIGPILVAPPASNPCVGAPPVAGYTFWYDASQTINSSHVWRDCSGNHYDATASSSGSYVDPVLTANAQNGLAGYKFSGGTVQTAMVSPSEAAGGPVSVIVAFQNGETSLASASPIDAGYNSYYSMEYSATYGPEFWYYGADYLSMAAVNNIPHYMVLANDTTANTMYNVLDGALLNSSTTSPAVSSSHVRTLGNFASFGAQTWQGYIYEVIEYPFVFTSPQFASIESYINGKWALNPGNLANLIMWLRADQAVSPTNGSKFASIVDLVNGNATYTQSTSANQFVWNASDASFGGKPSMTSVAASVICTTASTSAQPFTFYMAVNTTSPSSVQVILDNVSNTIEAGFLSGAYYLYSPPVSTGTVTSGSHAVAWVFNGSSSAVYVDSSASPIGTVVTSGSPGGSAFCIGGTGGSAGAGLLGNFPEALVYSTADSSSTVSTVFQYLAARYAQTWH